MHALLPIVLLSSQTQSTTGPDDLVSSGPLLIMYLNGHRVFLPAWIELSFFFQLGYAVLAHAIDVSCVMHIEKKLPNKPFVTPLPDTQPLLATVVTFSNDVHDVHERVLQTTCHITAPRVLQDMRYACASTAAQLIYTRAYDTLHACIRTYVPRHPESGS